MLPAPPKSETSPSPSLDPRYFKYSVSLLPFINFPCTHHCMPLKITWQTGSRLSLLSWDLIQLNKCTFIFASIRHERGEVCGLLRANKRQLRWKIGVWTKTPRPGHRGDRCGPGTRQPCPPAAGRMRPLAGMDAQHRHGRGGYCTSACSSPSRAPSTLRVRTCSNYNR